MGGLATVVAAAIIALVFLQVFSTYYNTSINTSNELISSIQEQANIQAQRLNEHVNIGSIATPKITLVQFNVTNSGQTYIPASTFDQMDVVMVYTLVITKIQYTLYLSYNTSSSSTNSWSVIQYFYGNTAGGGINQINLPSAISGMWNPTETLEIQVRLSTAYGAFPTNSITIVFSTPNGITSTGTS